MTFTNKMVFHCQPPHTTQSSHPAFLRVLRASAMNLHLSPAAGILRSKKGDPMKIQITRLLIAAALSLLLSESALAQSGQFGQVAPDFPPGLFNDGGQYKVADFEGKVLVLFFYEKDCPRCRGMIPARNEIVAKYKDKPVKFIAVAPGDTLPQATQYVGNTRLAMPVYADSLGLMEKRYGFQISLQNIWQFRVIGPDGKVAGYQMEEQDIDRALSSAKWTYKDKGFDPKLAAAVELFEWKQIEAGMIALRPHLKSPNKATAESARKLYDTIKTDHGLKWQESADKLAAEGKPAHAYALYTRLANTFTTDDLGKSAAEKVKQLKTDKTVKLELDAQRAYTQLLTGLRQATPESAQQVKTFAEGIVQKYPNTPTADRAQQLVEAI